MKTNKINGKNHGFTLIEMVGVLAVIAILAALLVPKIFAAINDSRFSNSVASLNTVKTATMDYFGKNGGFTATNNFDGQLLSGNFLERPLACKIASAACAQVISTGGVGATGYKLDGVNIATTNALVVECVLTNVAGADAMELSTRIDGPTMSQSDATVADGQGRVQYAAIASGAKGTVYVYIAHK